MHWVLQVPWVHWVRVHQVHWVPRSGSGAMVTSTAPRASGVDVALVREDEACAARPNDRRDLRGFVRRVERDGDGADAEDAQIRRAPAGIVVREDGDPVARRHAAAGEPGAGPLRGGPQLAVCEAIDAIAPLHFDGDAVAEPRRRLVEQLEEGIDAGIIATSETVSFARICFACSRCC